MTRAATLQLISDLSATQSDDTEATVLYDEVIRELGFYEVLTNREDRFQPAILNGIYKLSPDTMRVLEVAWDNRRLDRASEYALRVAFGAAWRLIKGIPLAMTVWDESASEMRLVPQPTDDGTVTLVRTEVRDDLPYWLELPVALMTIQREFTRESNHQDLLFATVALNLGKLFLAFVGVKIFDVRPTEEQ